MVERKAAYRIDPRSDKITYLMDGEPVDAMQFYVSLLGDISAECGEDQKQQMRMMDTAKKVMRCGLEICRGRSRRQHRYQVLRHTIDNIIL